MMCFQLSEKLLAGVRGLLDDLFEHGSVLGLQVAGGPAEYYIRVRPGLGENRVQAFSLRCGSACSRSPGLW